MMMRAEMFAFKDKRMSLVHATASDSYAESSSLGFAI